MLTAQCPAVSLSLPAARGALAALADDDYVRQSVARNADSRQEFQNQVNARMLRSVDSQASFVLLESGRQVETVVEHFRAHAVALADPLAGHPRQLRVVLGTIDEMRAFWRVWDLMPAGPMVM